MAWRTLLRESRRWPRSISKRIWLSEADSRRTSPKIWERGRDVKDFISDDGSTEPRDADEEEVEEEEIRRFSPPVEESWGWGGRRVGGRKWLEEKRGEGAGCWLPRMMKLNETRQ
jgi:hypothetical protein